MSIVCLLHLFRTSLFLYVSQLVSFIAVLFHSKSRYRASPVRPLHYNTPDILFLVAVQWLQSNSLQGFLGYPFYASSPFSLQPHEHPLSSSDKQRHVEGIKIFNNVEVTFPHPSAAPRLLLAWASTAAPLSLSSAVQPAQIAPTSNQPLAMSPSSMPPSIQITRCTSPRQMVSTYQNAATSAALSVTHVKAACAPKIPLLHHHHPVLPLQHLHLPHPLPLPLRPRLQTAQTLFLWKRSLLSMVAPLLRDFSLASSSVP